MSAVLSVSVDGQEQSWTISDGSNTDLLGLEHIVVHDLVFPGLPAEKVWEGLPYMVVMELRLSSFAVPPGLVGMANAEIYLTHTFRWLGATAFVNGVEITDLTVTDADGLDWTQAIPVDWSQRLATFVECMDGPNTEASLGCDRHDAERDTDVDLADYRAFLLSISVP